MKQKRPRLQVWLVRPWKDRRHGRGHGWAFRMAGTDWWYPTKAHAVRVARTEARQATQKKPVSVRIFGKNGTIQEERTYPRSADPRRSKG